MEKEFLILMLKELQNKICWSIIGPSVGSIISFDFGKRILRNRTLKNPNLTEEQQKYKGEYSILINCAWRLESKDKVIIGSENESDEIALEIQVVKYMLVTDIKIFEPAFDLQIEFDNKLRFNIFCNLTNPDFMGTNYDFYIPDGCISIGCKAHLTFEKK